MNSDDNKQKIAKKDAKIIFELLYGNKKVKKYKKSGNCSLCNGKYEDWGHNPEPIKRFGERCCSNCNKNLVVPTRIKLYFTEKSNDKKI